MKLIIRFITKYTKYKSKVPVDYLIIYMYLFYKKQFLFLLRFNLVGARKTSEIFEKYFFLYSNTF